MAIIRQLDDHLANKIAAGEIVERPVNVVKELVENSIDAGSTKITVLINGGGKLGITIIDNGKGMDKADAMMCFSRHATSKIRDDHDLYCISTLGFRGEAMPSIASISDMTLETSNGDAATKVVYHFGKCVEVSQSDIQVGTTIVVDKLFQNVPARLKFLRAVNTEFASIQSFIEKISLCYPHISFVLDHDGKPVFRTSGNGSVPEIMARLYGVDIARGLIEIKASNDDFTLSGYTSKIGHTRASKKDMMIMVNGRVIKNQVAVDSIYQAYRKFLDEKRFPIVLLNIQVDPYLVDVNVHPTKLEVRFSKEFQLRELVYKTFQETLGVVDQTFEVKAPVPVQVQQEMKISLVEEPKVSYQMPVDDGVVVPKSETVVPKVQAMRQSTTEIVIQPPRIEREIVEPCVEEVKEVREPISSKDTLEVQGQVHGTYIICSDKEAMYLVDQHAAQERIFYEYYVKQYQKMDMRYTELLLPIILKYPLSEVILIQEHVSLFEGLGIILKQHDQGFAVSRIPMWMNNVDEKVFIEEMICEVMERGVVDVVELQKTAISTLSCKASIKANSFLTKQVMQGLIDKLMRCDNPYVCPHGRPTIIRYSSYELEKMFKRVS